MKRLRRLPAVLTAGALFAGLLLYDVSAAGAPQLINCDHTWAMTFDPGLTLVPQDGVTAKVGDPDGALRKCTGDPAMTMGDFVGEGVGNSVTCAAGNYQDKPGTAQHVVWDAKDGQPTTDYTWKMSPIGDLLNTQTPLSGGITQGRYKGSTWTMVLDPLRSKINLTDCTSATGLKSITVAGTLVITTG